ncbi:hypothetical protein SDC9_106686 [bioreactor metagenome]|uniref:Uncharacterized protein n=1 Tax=bioreactor metagenome TaxID=1076179 RepID=A0A645B301_9ZZZZ
MKTSVRIILLMLAIIFLFGCSATEPRYSNGQDLSYQSSLGATQEAETESAQTSEEPLAFSDQEDQTQNQRSFLNLSINGEIQEMELVGLVQSGGVYSVMYWARDVRNNMLGSVSLMIPVRGLAGDQFSDTDAYAGLPMANIIYSDRKGNNYSTYDDSQSDYNTYDEFINPSAPQYREGRKFVIAIDDVSSDGNVISGRLIAEFNGQDNDSNDNTVIKIDESSFAFDVRDGSK